MQNAIQPLLLSDIQQSPKHFRSMVFQYLQPESPLQPLQKKGSQAKFIPYGHERDHLGNLLTKTSKTSLTSSPKNPASSKTKFKSFDSRLPTPPSDNISEQEFNFESFKYSSQFPNSPVRNSLQKILKPLPSTHSHSRKISEAKSSSSFLSCGRVDIPIKQCPSIGYYKVSDTLLHRSATDITFPRVKKEVLQIQPKETAKKELDNVDIIDSYNKVYSKGQGIPDFTKQTTRANHFLKKYNFQKSSKIEDKISEYENINSKYAPGKDNSNEFTIKLRNLYQVNQKNLPLTNMGIHDKFGQIKKKYHISYVKLK